MLSHPAILALFFLMAHGNASNFRIVNNCGETLNVQWSGGSVTLGPNSSADQWFADRTSSGTIWADTNGKWSPGPASHSQAEFTLSGPDGDSYDASFIKGTNLNVDICPVDGTYSGNCPCGSTCAYRAFKRPDNQTVCVFASCRD
ncbi:hypothetical protein AAVH_10658 [Aphelenchoides avenae]|nr:hypothetical protein AAVH_10658 [Aphelenchus avenae]